MNCPHLPINDKSSTKLFVAERAVKNTVKIAKFTIGFIFATSIQIVLMNIYISVEKKTVFIRIQCDLHFPSEL